ncbi:hypothetical protein K439DRAFT_1620074 [Ramaria rubella]|nr:hypothetical protein K439DRAFT_1620074 [Ramaria rubella]
MFTGTVCCYSKFWDQPFCSPVASTGHIFSHIGKSDVIADMACGWRRSSLASEGDADVLGSLSFSLATTLNAGLNLTSFAFTGLAAHAPHIHATGAAHSPARASSRCRAPQLQHTLASFSELHAVKDFTVDHIGFVTIRFLQPVDLTSVLSIRGKMVTLEHVTLTSGSSFHLERASTSLRESSSTIARRSTRALASRSRIQNTRRTSKSGRAQEGAEYVSFDMETGVRKFMAHARNMYTRLFQRKPIMQLPTVNLASDTVHDTRCKEFSVLMRRFFYRAITHKTMIQGVQEPQLERRSRGEHNCLSKRVAVQHARIDELVKDEGQEKHEEDVVEGPENCGWGWLVCDGKRGQSAYPEPCYCYMRGLDHQHIIRAVLESAFWRSFTNKAFWRGDTRLEGAQAALRMIASTRKAFERAHTDHEREVLQFARLALVRSRQPFRDDSSVSSAFSKMTSTPRHTRDYQLRSEALPSGWRSSPLSALCRACVDELNAESGGAMCGQCWGAVCRARRRDPALVGMWAWSGCGGRYEDGLHESSAWWGVGIKALDSVDTCPQPRRRYDASISSMHRTNVTDNLTKP